MTDLVELAQALNSRLCHEFAGAIGAIDNCIGLITIKDEAVERIALQLIRENTGKLINKLKLYRYAYSISDDSDNISMQEIIELSEKFLESDTYQVKLECTFGNSINIPFNISKVLLSLIIEAYSNFIKNGTIKVDLCEDKSNCYKINVKVTSKTLKIDKSKSNILLGKNLESSLTIYNVHEYYLYYLIQKLGYKLYSKINLTDNIVEYIVETY